MSLSKKRTSEHFTTLGVSPLCAHGQLHSDAPSKAQILSEQFKSVFTRDDATVSVTRLPGPDFPSISPLTIEPHGVWKSYFLLSTHGRLLDLMKSQRVFSNIWPWR